MVCLFDISQINIFIPFTESHLSKMKRNHLVQLFAVLALIAINIYTVSGIGTFYNPIRAAESPDPWVYQKDGFYYYMVTTGDGVWIHKSSKLETVGNATRTKVWSSPNGDIKGAVWAPELHYFNGKWYIYASGSISATSDQMRMFVLEGLSQDALGSYKYIGLLNGGVGAIDEDLWQDPLTNKLYMTWSQWDPDQSIFIAEMTSPTALSNKTVKLSTPTAAWEQKGWNVNEGPAFIKHGDALHIVFSVSGCSTSDYALAKLTCTNGNYLNASAWTKSTGPIFTRNESNKVWGVGHQGFTKSPDGTEDWLVYHAKSNQTNSNADRSTRIQPFTWDVNNNPVFGDPYPTNLKLPCPSDGTGTKQTITFDPIPTKSVSDPSFSLSATASSGLSVSYIIQNGPATVLNGTIQLTGKPGTIKVWATQAGNNTYCAAWPVYREFNVTSTNIPTGTGDGLNATYFNGSNWDTDVLSRIDSNINFDWGLNSPATEINIDHFSANWKGYILPLYTDVYNFSIISDNGRRLKIKNTIIIDHLSGDWDKEYVGSIHLTAGVQSPIEIDYFEEVGGANIKMYWWSNNQNKQIVPQSQLSTTLTSGIKSSSSESKVLVYLNPAQNTVTVRTPKSMNSLHILNSVGLTVQNNKINNTKDFTCQIESLPAGVYFIKANCDNTVYSEKFIIRK